MHLANALQVGSLDEFNAENNYGYLSIRYFNDFAKSLNGFKKLYLCFSASDNEGVMFNCAVGKIGSKCIAS